MDTPVAGHSIRRPRLTSRLVDDVAQLTVISAPSGFGKTTLLKEWVNSGMSRGPVIWVSLTEELPDEVALWRLVIRAGGRAGVLTDVEGVLHQLDIGQEPAAIADELLAGSTGPVHLLIDAFERAGAHMAAFEEIALRLVAQHPQLHIVLTTRGGSTLTSPRMRLRSEIRVIDADEMAFTEQETAEIAAGATPDARTLHATTSGYPLALRAALLGGSVPRPQAGDRPWAHLAAEVLLEALPDEVREFVRCTAIPPYFDLELAAALSRLPDPNALITAAERQGLGRWVPFEPEHPVFQYVDGIREVLAHTSSPDAESHELAATWLFEHDDLTGALRLALAARLYGLASRILSRLLLLNSSTYSSTMLHGYLAEVPVKELAAYPMIAFCLGLSLIPNIATRPAAARYLMLASRTDVDARLPHDDPEVLRFIKVVSLRILGRFEESAEAAREAIAFMPRHRPTDIRNWREHRAASLRHHAYSLFQGGDIARARSAVAQGITIAAMPWSRNQTLVYSVGIDAFDGRHRAARAAEAMVDQAAWAPGQELTFVNALGKIGHATLLLDEFAYEDVLRTYEGCQFLDNGEVWPFVSWTTLLARTALGQGSAEARRIEELLASPVAPPGVGANLATAALRNALAIAWLAEGQRHRALAHIGADGPHSGQLAPALLLGHLLDGAHDAALARVDQLRRRPGHTLRSRSALSTLGAAAALRAGNPRLAGHLLADAASSYAENGHRALLAVVPAQDLAALRASCGSTPALARYLDAPTAGLDYPATVLLSEREQEVLATLTRHRVREEAAAELHVSVNTVKAHQKSIYRKLGVANRGQAVARAIELGLLPDGGPSRPARGRE